MIVKVEKINEVNIRVTAEASILYELHDYFSFLIPNHRFNPKVRAGIWDGKIRVFHLGKRTLPAGLFKKLQEFCDARGYTVESEDICDEDISLNKVLDFIRGLNLPPKLKPREYQIKAFVKCLRKKRLTLLSPTSSGKSLIIYLICRWYGLKTLLIVPTISLVNQMADDFYEYGYEEEIHKITGGAEKYSDELITISTWQSIYKLDKEFFQQYQVVIGDEAHLAKAQCFSTIMEKLTDCVYRFGTTGTLDDSKVNPIIIQGHFGEIYRSISTAEMIDQGYASQLNIKALVLKYPQETAQLAKGLKYQDEIDFLCSNRRRNQFIKNLVASLEGNTIVFFNYVEKHGRVIQSIFEKELPDREIFWISGATDGDERNEIRKIVNTKKNAILLASIKTSGTGMNIPNLDNMVFISPSKAKVQTLQNIGRLLRLGNNNDVTLYDIADDLSYKKYVNYTLKHFRDRIKIYDAEKFPYKIYTIGVKA